MRAVFIRHGQSTGNAGVPCHDLASIELTELGWRQAREVARAWTEAPTLIVTSPYLRTRQTAEATIQRFPNVPVEVWPIEEFTYLQPSRWNGTRSSERMPHLERYWTDADPTYCDGDGAESFGHCFAAPKRRLRASPPCPPPASPMCSATGSSFKPCVPLSRNPIWMTEARCCASGERASRPQSATPSWCSSRGRMPAGTINPR